MDPIFEPIFDPVENMNGYPYQEIKGMMWGSRFQLSLDVDDFHPPYRTFGGYLVNHNPRTDYVIDEDEIDQANPSIPSLFSRSFYSSSSFTSSSNGNSQYETIKTSIRQPDGTQIVKEIVRENGKETVVTKTTFPDGRIESTTETRGNALQSNNMPQTSTTLPQPTEVQNSPSGGLFSSIRRWFRSD